MGEQELLDQRIQRIKDVYLNVDTILDKIPEELPFDAKAKIRSAILDDKGLKELIEDLDNRRPPRIFIVGRTGIGKSSLINAICGAYVASVDDTTSCTKNTVTYPVKSGNRILMEVCDTRGTKESITNDKSESAEKQLVDDLCRFAPDAAIYVLDCSRRDDVVSDIAEMKHLCKEYQKRMSVSLPLVVVLNKCDGVQPEIIKEPKDYPLGKWKNIDKMVVQYSDIFNEKGLDYQKVIPVSSYIEWHDENGVWLSSAEEIDALTKEQVAKLTIGRDGRVNIEELKDFLSEAIQDRGARMGWRMAAARLTDVAKNLAEHLCKVFVSLAGLVGASPIPGHDIIYLTVLQAILVILIAGLGGHVISIEEAKAFIVSLAGIGGIGVTFRMLTQQLLKLLNGKILGAGSLLSGFVAASGTKLIGSVAIDYYINGLTAEEVKKKFKFGIEQLNLKREKNDK